ncbi:hypothetical protein K488DRAFT_92527 [Vararia minispora EC-137]|uniref:Uncharacterized protein n=1 Tax=Vararia minispora EC-137 TaxID=1314806 RepID=A0ACB8Q418_9AGAM|nr:hypothetical protein K488DRAFT_92527 [Vararia minispora EC-137]
MDRDFWCYGGKEIFGENNAQQIAMGDWMLRMGHLLCGCEPTHEKLQFDSKITSQLVQNMIFGLNQWALLHQLSALGENMLQEASYLEVVDRPVKHIMPDFLSAVHKVGMVANIKSIITKGKTMKDQRKHLYMLWRFLLFSNNHADYFKGWEGWQDVGTLGAQQLGSFNETKLDSVIQEYLDRFAITCLRAKQWPADFFYLLETTERFFEVFDDLELTASSVSPGVLVLDVENLATTLRWMLNRMHMALLVVVFIVTDVTMRRHYVPTLSFAAPTQGARALDGSLS